MCLESGHLKNESETLTYLPQRRDQFRILGKLAELAPKLTGLARAVKETARGDGLDNFDESLARLEGRAKTTVEGERPNFGRAMERQWDSFTGTRVAFVPIFVSAFLLLMYLK